MLLLWAVLYAFISKYAIAQEPFYTVVAPQVISPFSDYHVTVSTIGLSEPINVHAEISGKKNSGGNVFLSEMINIIPYHSQTITFKVNDISDGTYNLTVRSEGSFRFHNTTRLHFRSKSYSVFIQTDKPIYKPGDKVMFRALFLDPFMKPVRKMVDIFLSDGEQNVVKRWTNVTTVRGMFSAEIELSSSPLLGDWNLVTNNDGEQFHRKFEVAEYVLPKYEVSIDLPDYVTFKDSKAAVTIRAKYTYGKPVKGEATIAVHTDTFSDVIQPIFNPPIRKTIPIDGKAYAEFDLVKDLNLPDDFERQIRFEVTVKEDLTGRKQNNSAQLFIRKSKYMFEMFNTSSVFKPGLKHSVFIKLVHHDGTPVVDKTNPIIIRTSYSYSEDDFNSTEYKVPENGILELTYQVPLGTPVIQIEGMYLDMKEYFPTISSAVTLNNISMKASVKTPSPQVNQNVEVEVTCTSEMTYLIYHVTGKGGIIHSNAVNFPASKVTTIRFVATYAMAPAAHILVQFISKDGELIADNADIEFDRVLQNYVKISPSIEKAEPGNNIDLSISARPNSLVGLLAIDQSVLLLDNSGDNEFDITMGQVMNELRTYDYADMSFYDGPSYLRGERKKRFASYSMKKESLTTNDSFKKVGVIVMTNAEVNAATPWRYFRGMYPEADYDMVAMSRNLAVPVAYAGAGGFSQQEDIRVRTNFPETWIWEELDSGINGQTSISKVVPDTITSWVISAFSLDPAYGLGLIESPKKVTVFRPFFVSTNLPYSIIRGETISIPVVVFNYMDKDITAEVTLENSGQFEFSDYSNDVNDAPKLDLFRRKTVNVGRQSGASTSFMITAKELGYIDLKITAKSILAGDSIIKKLLVKPEGETQYKNKAILIDLRETNVFKANFTLDIPENIVPDSEFIEVSAVGDLLGTSISNLEHLIKMPFGCGEQNMLNFVPNIVILEYLKATNQLTKPIESKCINYMEKGYQREMTYKHGDGSFSAFGKADNSGSTWLTAFVVKSFIQARKFIDINNAVVPDALAWLARQQASNGSFPEVGTVSHKEMQGGAGSGIALTAYVLTAFLDAQSITGEYRNTINKALSYLHNNMAEADNYANTILAYAFIKANHPSGENVLHMLDRNAKNKDSMKWWERANIDKKNPNAVAPNGIDVEMSSYAMLAYIQRDLISESIPIMKWLITQQNNEGGFASTQDTILALTSLGQLASKIFSPNIDVSTKFLYKDGMSTDIRVNQGNSMILQKVELSKKIREINITASGRGFAIAQISYKYNVNVTGAWPLFTLDPQVDKNSDNNHLQLSICSAFTGGNESNMAVMEVSLPSGYVVDSDSLPSLEISQNVKRVETKEGDTVVVLYFDKMVAKEYCPTVSAFRTHRVAKQKPVPVTIYDYYDQSRRARVFYEPIVATPCDICEGEDCKICSGSRAGSRSDDKGAANLFAPSLFLLSFSAFSTFYLMR